MPDMILILQMAADVSFSGANRVMAWELVTRGFLSWFWDGLRWPRR